MRKYLEDQDKIQEEINKNIRTLRGIEDQEKKYQNDLNLTDQKIASYKERLHTLESQHGMFYLKNST